MKNLQRRLATASGIFFMVMAAIPFRAQAEEEGGLAALMERNKEHFQSVVETAFLTSLDKQLQEVDFQGIRQDAEAISGLMRQARENHSRGDQFDDLAKDVEEHATKAAEAASKQKLPEINVEVGEMAEYCAECHNTYRW